LIASLEPPFSLNAMEVHVSASIGVASSTPESNAAALLSNADLAMYHAKAAGKNRFATFEPKMLEMLNERLSLEADLSRALANQEFFLEYQPIVDLGTHSPAGCRGARALAAPHLGVLLPGRFIHVAEECGHVVKLGRWVLTQACCEMYEPGAVRWRVASGCGSRSIFRAVTCKTVSW
jgi:predicted signal transduction protein with EAL and GGDEF domain